VRGCPTQPAAGALPITTAVAFIAAALLEVCAYLQVAAAPHSTKPHTWGAAAQRGPRAWLHVKHSRAAPSLRCGAGAAASS
jgi:hypothetical protein